MSGQKYICSFLNFANSVTFPPYSASNLHTHEMCEIFCVFRGDGYYITEGSMHKFEHGKIFLMRSGEMHKPYLTNREPYERIALHFDASIVDGIDPERKLLSPFFDRPLGKNNVYNRSIVASTGIYDSFIKMGNLSDSNASNDLHVAVLLFSVLSELKQLFDAKLYDEPNSNTATMQAVVEYINQNLSNTLSVDSICEKFFLSRGQFNRNFKKTTGSTVWDYITIKRLMLAKAYMEDGMSAGDAAIACGYGDYSSFFRAYLKKYGTTPTGQVR